MRRRRIGVADYRFGARLHSEIAQPLRVPFACSRKTNDGSRNRLARWVDYAPVMQGLDGEFEFIEQDEILDVFLTSEDEVLFVVELLLEKFFSVGS